jgi:hypothetical protein
MQKLAALLVLSVVAVASTASGAEPASPGPASNVTISLIVGRQGGSPGSKERTYKLLAEEGSDANLLMGWRTPIPTRSSEDKAGAAPTMSYVYQNVGVTANLKVQPVAPDRYVVRGGVEVSGAREGEPDATAGKPPLIGTFNQALQVVVQRGRRVRVAEVPEPEGGTLFLDLLVDRAD